MNIKQALLSISLLLLTTLPAAGQGFAGLGTTAEGFEKVVPGRTIRFPQDYGPHPGFRLEWWYVTANLRAADGEQLGLQWTLFRQATKPGKSNVGWSGHEFWMGHAALTTATAHFDAEKLARGGTGQAGAAASPISAWIDDWQFAASSTDKTYSLKAGGDTFRYALALTETGPHVRHGDNGFSVKSDQGQASYYFSHPFLQATGTVTIGDKDYVVTGNAWLDREWSSQPLAQHQSGWDWFSLKFKTGERLMVFGLRDTAGGMYRSGSWIQADGSLLALKEDDIKLIPLNTTTVEGRPVPTRWRVVVASQGVDLTVSALNPDSWMQTSIPYWEGPVNAEGSHAAVGYLEMTGY